MNNKSGVVLLFALMFVAMVLVQNTAAAGSLAATPNPPMVTNAIIDVGQISAVSTIISNAIAPSFIGNWIYTPSLSSNILLGNTISFTLPTSNNGLQLTVNALSSTQIMFVFTTGSSSTLTAPGTNTIYGTWTFNGFAKSSADATNTVLTIGNTITIYSKPTVTSLTPSNVLLDSGQSVTYNVILSGGHGPFTVNLIDADDGGVVNTLTNQNAGTLTFIANIPEVEASETFNVVATDTGTTTPFVFNSVSNVITVNALPTLSTPLPNRVLLDAGQSVTYNTILAGGTGTGPFTVNLVSGGTVVNTIIVQYSAAAQTITFGPNTPAQGSPSFNVVATDTGTTTPFVFNSVSNVITVNALPTLSTPLPNRVLLDAGQSVTYNTILAGGTGTGPFTVNLVSGGTVVNTIIVQYSAAAQTITFGPNTPAQGSPSFNVVATDTGTTTPFVFNSVSNTITVSAALAAGLLTESNTVIDIGQYTLLTANPSGGTATYTYNWFANTVGSPGCNAANVVAGAISSTYSINPSVTTYYTYNVVDSASTKTSVCSASNTVTVEGTAATVTLTSTASIGTVTNSIVYGNTVTVNALAAGGSGAFSFAWTLNGASVSGTSIGTMGSSYVLTVPAVDSYAFNVVATDTGTSFVLPQVSNTVVMNKNATAGVVTYSDTGHSAQTTSTSASYTAAYYDVAGISFVGVSTINGQSPWNVYKNGALVSTTNSLYSFGEQAQVGTYTFTFNNPGNANYISDAFTVTLNVQNQPTGGGGSTGGGGASYTTTVTTTSTTLSTAATTTIIPVVPTVNGTANVTASAGAPVEVNVTGIPASIVITTSGGSATVEVGTSDVTSSSSPAPVGYTKLIAVNITLSTTGTIVVNATLSYPCSLPAGSIVPYIQKNGTWIAITPFTVNSGSCTVTFTVPKDPVVGLFENNTVSTTTTTTVLPTTTLPVTVAPTTIAQPTYGSSGTTYLIAAIVVIVIVAVIAYAMLKGKKKSRRGA